MTIFSRSLILGCSTLALAACGPEDIASPGGGNVVINLPPTVTPTPTPTSGTPTIPAGACPSLTNDGSVALTANPVNLGDGRGGSYLRCNLPALITKTVTLPRIPGLLYVMNGRVDVGCDGGFSAPTAGAPFTSTTIGCAAPLTADTNVTLNIEPGVVLIGGTGQSWLAVNRGNKINAVGTAARPIIFTSEQNAAGINTDTTPGGQWGGVVLMGRAKITDCALGTVAGGDCQRRTEGAANDALYGGNDDTYNAGSLRYAQIRYSGFVLSNNLELQALTTEGVGTGTTIDHIQSHRSSDDGAEFFGGTFNMSHFIVTAADDDSLDVDTGARVNIQHALLLQNTGEGDALFEIDSNGKESDLPRTKLQISNFTAVQTAVSSNNETNDRASALFRGNSDTTLYNGVIISPANECIRMTSNTSVANRATLTARSVVMQCAATKYIGDGTGVSGTDAGDGEFLTADVAGFFGTGTNNNSDAFTGTLSGGFLNGTAENGVSTTSPVTLSSFFVTTPTPFRVGAAWAENNSWYSGWTCSSSVANFGTGSCTTLPST